MRNITVSMMAALFLLCAGCGSKDVLVYELAVKAVKAQPAVPSTANVKPMDETKVFVGKSQATVVVVLNTGASYTVWLKDLGKRWVVDRCEPTPTFD